MADADLAGKDDIEKQGGYDHNGDSALPAYKEERSGSVTSYHEGFFSAFKPESFKRNPNARVVTEATDNEGRPLADQPPAEPALAMKLKERHLQMIAIGGSIGTDCPA
jgi:amino acid transporter